MSKSSKCLHDLQGVSKGITKVADAFVKTQLEVAHRNANQLFVNDLEHIRHDLESKILRFTANNPKENLEKLNEKASAFIQQTRVLLKTNAFSQFTTFSSQKRSFHHLNHPIKYNFSLRRLSQKTNDYTSVKDTEKNKIEEKFAPKLNKFSKERQVPATRISRLVNFGNLAAGLGVGAMQELTKRALGQSNSNEKLNTNSLIDSSKSIFLTEENITRVVDTLCKVRGAALKLGQMLSIQDDALLSPTLQRIFERVRQSADFMPFWQTEQVLKRDWGENYMEKFESFEKTPFAAASIGQVHMAKLKTGEKVAVKIQYPGVSQSIISDIDNLMSVLNVTQLLPKQMYIENVVTVMKRELLDECDYVREANCNLRFSELLKDDKVFLVPKPYTDLTTKNILVADYVEGLPFDMCKHLNQEENNYIGYNMLRLCLKELFEFNYMQTDPNWSNFLYNSNTNKIYLLDFGATREFSKVFVDKYIKIIRAAADANAEAIIKHSIELKFLTGYETKTMKKAHADAVLILGEAFAKNDTFDFGLQDTTRRINNLVPVMLKERLTPPPDETYSLHRKMSGAFLLCAKLKAKINCYNLFDEIWKKYKFTT